MGDADQFLDKEGIEKILKAALPNQSELIDGLDPNSYYYLLDVIEGSLLAELRKILEGKEADEAATVRAKTIMEAVRQVDEDVAKRRVLTALSLAAQPDQKGKECSAAS
jgi:hypothetical protein